MDGNKENMNNEGEEKEKEMKGEWQERGKKRNG